MVLYGNASKFETTMFLVFVLYRGSAFGYYFVDFVIRIMAIDVDVAAFSMCWFWI